MESQVGGLSRQGSSDFLSAEDDQVMSEIHLGCPAGHSGLHFSHFVIRLPSIKDEHPGIKNAGIIKDEFASTAEVCGLDKDGDLILTRKSKASRDGFVVTIRHKITSSIPNVGLQVFCISVYPAGFELKQKFNPEVWRAELVLADFLLHKMFTSSEIDGVFALELGAGTGLVGILLARAAKTVFITDRGKEVLDNCAENVSLNVGVVHRNASVHVHELDWNCSWQPQLIEDSQSDSEESYSWTSSEVEDYRKASLLVAADVIYSDDLTDAFFSTLESIMSVGPEKVLYLALEKRYNFSLDDLDIVANGYLHFRRYLSVGDYDEVAGRSKCMFLGKPVDLTQIPQYVMEYDRGSDVELWQIKYEKGKQC